MVDNTASILDGTLDDLADLPGFKQPPTGAYGVGIVSVLEKKIGDHPAVEAKFSIKSVEEVTEQGIAEADMPIAGEEFNTIFILDNDTGSGFFKEFCKPLGEKLGIDPAAKGYYRAVMEQCKGMDLLLVLKRTYNKDKDSYYLNIKKMEIL